MKKFIAFVILLSTLSAVGQSVYKTPSGKKYHLASCRMVENVSEKLTSQKIAQYHLTACKICKPPVVSALKYSSNLTTKNKAVGTATSVRCKGKTKKGTRCKHQTKLANGYCFQHRRQAG